ncbi:MAG: hypothetical protein KAI24_14065 [Planctomycetes bacterium]|nr:hypothetical protein [Planctomycetota bacterium]
MTIVPAVAPRTRILCARPLYGRIASTRWYTQFYWPFVLDRTEAGEQHDRYDRLLVDRNHDGDMEDEGEVVRGTWVAELGTVRFEVGELFFDGKGNDRTFQLRELVVQATAGKDPEVTFALAMDQRMFGETSYRLSGPHGTTMRFAEELARMPTINLTPEIAAGPDFDAHEIRLVPVGTDRSWRIGEQVPLHLACVTGDPDAHDHVLAIENGAFVEPVTATLVYQDQDGVTRGRVFRLADRRGTTGFAGELRVPADATPGAAKLVLNFSETIERGGGRVMYRHFTQLVFGGEKYVDADGASCKADGWSHPVTLTR